MCGSVTNGQSRHKVSISVQSKDKERDQFCEKELSGFEARHEQLICVEQRRRMGQLIYMYMLERHITVRDGNHCCIVVVELN